MTTLNTQQKELLFDYSIGLTTEQEAAKAEEFFQIDSINAGFSGCKPPHGFKPKGDRFFGTIHNRTGS